MKKSISLAISALLSISTYAQTNLQLFYDFGKDRKQVTATFEMFKADKWGNNYLFIDHDFRTKSKDGYPSLNNGNEAPCGTYWEISRALNFWQDTKFNPLSLHIEYNGGVYDNYYVNNAWLFGIEYGLHSADYNNMLTLQVLYKTIAKTTCDIPMQITVVWGMQDIFGIKGLLFSGFADFWWQDHIALLDDGKSEDRSTTFVTEPQIWYNVGKLCGCENLNVGSEIELSKDFGTYDGIKCNPCLGVKWNF